MAISELKKRTGDKETQKYEQWTWVDPKEDNLSNTKRDIWGVAHVLILNQPIRNNIFATSYLILCHSK